MFAFAAIVQKAARGRPGWRRLLLGASGKLGARLLVTAAGLVRAVHRDGDGGGGDEAAAKEAAA
jgi:hypothetical protein